MVQTVFRTIYPVYQKEEEQPETHAIAVSPTAKLESAIARLAVAKLDYPTMAEVKELDRTSRFY
jgi:hypothetical protein